MRVGGKVHKLKNSYDIISAVDNIYDQWDPCTVILMEEVCGLLGHLKNKPHLITFHGIILVNL